MVIEIGVLHRNFTIASQNDRPIGVLNCFAGKMMGDIYQSHLQLIPGVLTAEAAPRLVRGLVAMGWLFPFVPRDALYILNVAVSQKARRTGIGAKLMGLAEEKAKSEGLKSMHLDIPSASPAIKFYERLGYQTLVETRLCQLREDENVRSIFGWSNTPDDLPRGFNSPSLLTIPPSEASMELTQCKRALHKRDIHKITRAPNLVPIAHGQTFATLRFSMRCSLMS